MGVPVRLALLLLLFPLSALAACPAGISLSNLPIGTPLPMCVKFESSSLGGCYVGCSEVCIELPAIGTMGPIQTLGTECAYGSGGDGEGEGGDGGTDGNVGGHNSQAVIGEYADPPRYINDMLVGPEHLSNIGPAFDSMLTELGMLKIGVGHLKKNTNSQINLLADIDSDTSHIYSTLGQIQNEAIKLGADLDNDLNAVLGSLGAIVRNTSNGDSNNGGSGGNPSGDKIGRASCRERV